MDNIIIKKTIQFLNQFNKNKITPDVYCPRTYLKIYNKEKCTYVNIYLEENIKGIK